MHIFFFFSPWLLVTWAMPHEHFKTPCQWLLEPRLGLMICRKTHWAQHTVEGTAMIYDHERLLGKSAKGKVHGARSRGKQAQSSKSPVPVELRRMYFFIPSAVSYYTCEVSSTREAHYKLHGQGLYWGQLRGTLCLLLTKVPGSQKKSRDLA